VIAVLVEDVLEPLPIEARARQAVGAVDAVLDLIDPEPRPQVLRAAFVRADDLREALELVVWVREPVAVVRVLRVVVSTDVRKRPLTSSSSTAVRSLFWQKER
jgi:hypothetical protein